MVEERAVPGALEAGTAGVIVPSVWNTLPFFMLLAIFPLVINAAIQGGWWIAAPYVFLALANSFDTMFGTEERSMDLKKPPESRLFWYKLPVWLWAALWPVTLVFVLWQMLVAGHLSTWEAVLMALVLSSVAQAAFIVGHELIHRRSLWERRLAEFLLASVSYPHYATEHVYIHHALVGTPGDVGSAPKGESFWKYFPREVKSNLLGAWRFEQGKLARRHLPVWHYTNPFWRYIVETAAWYALVYWMGGAWVVLIFFILCLSAILSMKIINYVQHYGLQRIRLPNGRFERILPRHSWNAASRFTNWLYFNMQRHPDHHAVASRIYPLLQHHAADDCPQLPGSYSRMAGLALSPKRWFETMDPLVDEWRARFHPQITDWRAYDSPAYAARPDSFEVIAEILDAEPRLAEWINRAPELLDSLQGREFTDLDLPDGFGPDPEFEAVARQGLARVYWTHEFGVPEMKEQIADSPIQDVRDAVEIARNWSNEKVFQICVHVMRGNLSQIESGTALSNVAEASICSVLSAVKEDFVSRRAPQGEGGVAAMLLSDPAGGEVTPGAELEVVFVYDGGPAEYYQALCRRFFEALRGWLRDNLLFSTVSNIQEELAVLSLANITEQLHSAQVAGELADPARSRCVFESGNSGIRRRFESLRSEIHAKGAIPGESPG